MTFHSSKTQKRPPGPLDNISENNSLQGFAVKNIINRMSTCLCVPKNLANRYALAASVDYNFEAATQFMHLTKQYQDYYIPVSCNQPRVNFTDNLKDMLKMSLTL